MTTSIPNVLRMPLALLLGTMLLAGCGKTGKSDGDKSGNPPNNNKASAPNADGFTAEQMANFAKLPEDERKAAMAQKYCPVGGGQLAVKSMGKPIKVDGVTWNGKPVFVCCGGCTGAVKKDPQKYFEKLDVMHSKEKEKSKSKKVD